MKKLFTHLLLLFGFLFCYGQNPFRGRVIDATDHKPLAFANLIFNNESTQQAVTDIDGYFTFSTKKTIQSITCSYVGYATKKINLIGSSGTFTIAIMPVTDELNEITVHPGMNPANHIIREVIRNKKRNNPENLPSFTYQSYNKTVYDYVSKRADKKDSIAIRKVLKNAHLFLMESITNRKFLSPDTSEEKVIATKVSGFKNPSFAALATDLQPFSFYKDNLKLVNVNYLNPISDGSLSKYRFQLVDTILKEKDTVFIITFKPLPNKNFDGLTGMLYINSNHYAIQYVVAEASEKGKISLKIQQQYQWIDNRYWFPEQLNYRLTLEEYPTQNIGMSAEGKSYISQVMIGSSIRKKEFAPESIYIAPDATSKDSSFWQASRKQLLTTTEKKTYVVLDSIGKQEHFDYYLRVLEKISQSRIPVTFFDLDLSKTLLVNHYEGIRLGTGLYTNEKLSNSFSLGGFFGYGVKDEKWKYGAGLQFVISKKKELSIDLSYQDNILEVGTSGLSAYSKKIFDFRTLMGYRFDHIRQSSIALHVRPARNLETVLKMRQTASNPLYIYIFQKDGLLFTNYQNTVASIYLRLGFHEKRIASFGTTFTSASPYPVLHLFYSHGLQVFNGDFNYNKIELAADHTFYSLNLGQTSYRFEMGYIDTSLPVGLLFTGEGSDDKKYPFLAKNTFQTMLPYEFLSDTYVHLFLSHDFGGLLFRAGKFQPEVIWHNNAGWGSLSSAYNHLGYSYKSKEKIYLETGIQLNNVIKFNFMNLGYLGFGGGIFYRYGAYANLDYSNNFAYKFSLRYSIK